jgi:hypothetical protein
MRIKARFNLYNFAGQIKCYVVLSIVDLINIIEPSSTTRELGITASLKLENCKFENCHFTATAPKKINELVSDTLNDIIYYSFVYACCPSSSLFYFPENEFHNGVF